MVKGTGCKGSCKPTTLRSRPRGLVGRLYVYHIVLSDNKYKKNKKKFYLGTVPKIE